MSIESHKWGTVDYHALQRDHNLHSSLLESIITRAFSFLFVVSDYYSKFVLASVFVFSSVNCYYWSFSSSVVGGMEVAISVDVKNVSLHVCVQLCVCAHVVTQTPCEGINSRMLSCTQEIVKTPIAASKINTTVVFWEASCLCGQMLSTPWPSQTTPPASPRSPPLKQWREAGGTD